MPRPTSQDFREQLDAGKTNEHRTQPLVCLHSERPGGVQDLHDVRGRVWPWPDLSQAARPAGTQERNQGRTLVFTVPVSVVGGSRNGLSLLARGCLRGVGAGVVAGDLWRGSPASTPAPDHNETVKLPRWLCLLIEESLHLCRRCLPCRTIRFQCAHCILNHRSRFTLEFTVERAKHIFLKEQSPDSC